VYVGKSIVGRVLEGDALRDRVLPGGVAPARNSASTRTIRMNSTSLRNISARALPRFGPGSRLSSAFLTLMVGPADCPGCGKLIVKNGLAYQQLNELAYGYSRPSTCVGGNDLHPLPPRPCIGWKFVDANTGQMIIATEQIPAAAHKRGIRRG
jgi:hypothetical protein